MGGNMELAFHKSFWESDCSDASHLDALLDTVQHEGYQGTELFLPFYDIAPDITLDFHRARDLNIIAGIATHGLTPKGHIASLEQQVARALEFEPLFINCHTGRDLFSFEDNLAIFKRALALEAETGVMLVHETHRTRPTFSTLMTEQLLAALPELKLNLDISHWMVVHETDLSDQAERVSALVKQAWHVHARVGYEEGPQVSDPASPLWLDHLHNHIGWWQQVVDAAQLRGQDQLTITPEFGPFPYAQVNPVTGIPLTDIWQANQFMHHTLAEQLRLA